MVPLLFLPVQLVWFEFGNLLGDVQLLSSIAVILGAIFVVFQIHQNNKLVAASAEQARASAMQAKLTTEQLKQNNELANMDLMMRLYEFANTAEFQSSWVTVINSNLSSFEQFEKLSRSEKISFFQVAALFESLGVLAERNIVSTEIVADMFATELAYESTRPFLVGMREKYGEEDTYFYFDKLYAKMKKMRESAARGGVEKLTC